MFTGFTDDTVEYLMDLKFHNSTDFFHATHDRYVEMVQKPFYELIEDLSSDMLKIDASFEIRPHKCLSRIHRDTRFSRDKSPYRDHLWFLFRKAAEPREGSVFYFFEFGPQRLDWGMGVWGDNRELFDLFRKHLRANPEGTLALLDDMELGRRRLYLGGREFKRMEIPAEIPPRLRRWYCARDLYIGKIEPDYGLAFSERLLKEIRRDFKAVSPLYRLLRGCADELADESRNERSGVE